MLLFCHSTSNFTLDSRFQMEKASSRAQLHIWWGFSRTENQGLSLLGQLPPAHYPSCMHTTHRVPLRCAASPAKLPGLSTLVRAPPAPTFIRPSPSLSMPLKCPLQARVPSTLSTGQTRCQTACQTILQAPVPKRRCVLKLPGCRLLNQVVDSVDRRFVSAQTLSAPATRRPHTACHLAQLHAPTRFLQASAVSSISTLPSSTVWPSILDRLMTAGCRRSDDP